MNVPLFVAVGEELINLSACERIYVDDTSLTLVTPNDSYEFEYESDEEAKAALSQLQSVLTAKNLCVAEI